VRKLAERSSAATKEIGAMIRTIQREANEAVQAMSQAGTEVSAAVKLTHQAGVAFRDIAEKSQGSASRMVSVREAVDAMRQASQQLEKTVAEAVIITDRNQQAAEVMGRLNRQMVASLDAVSAVVEENTASTEQMAAGSSEVALAIENIAAVSEENSAAVEEVSASAEEMTVQVEAVTTSALSLAEMAQSLLAIVARFKLEADAQPSPSGSVPHAALANPKNQGDMPLATGPYTEAMGFGAFTEIVSAVVKEMRRTPRYLYYPWKSAESEVQAGHALAAFPYMITDERQQQFDFSDAVLISTGKFFYLPQRHAGAIKYEKLEDLRAYTIGGGLGYWYEPAFKAAGLTTDFAATDEQTFEKLFTGRVDLVPIDELVGWALIKKLYPQHVDQFAVLEKPLNESSLHLMISRQYPGASELTRQFNAALKTIHANGTYQQIMKKYKLK
jgi:polar amino acid transport system substrate-binding protein